MRITPEERKEGFGKNLLPKQIITEEDRLSLYYADLADSTLE